MQGSYPPGLWQSDLIAGPSSSVSLPLQPQAAKQPVPDSAEKVAGAWRHVQQVLIEAGKDADLYDLLQSASREDTYQTHAEGWPSLVRPVAPVMCDLPAMVQAKYRTCQASCFCGIFPEIGRAWATVDNSLFLWRYDVSNDVPVEYRGEDQAIISVGIAKPRPQVFLEAIQYVLVLCTAVEIVLLGVCPGRKSQLGGDGPLGGELQLQPLPLYTIPSDNVLMLAVAVSASSRIFLAGSDGHLYEMLYASGDSWRQRRCSKVRLTGGLQQLLPAFLPTFVFGAPSPLVSVVVDDERHILYTLSQSGAIQVFDLGPNGTEATPRKVAEISDVVDAATKAGLSRDLFRSADKNRTTVKYIAPIPLSESGKLQLLALTSDGCRLFMTTQSLTARLPATPQEAAKQRPLLLLPVFARPALPQGPAAGRRGPTERQASGLEVVAAHYSYGTLLLSESTGAGERTNKLLIATRNLTRPGATVNTSSFTRQPGLRETVASLDNHIPGETCALVRMPTRSPISSQLRAVMRDELFTQIFVPPPRFVVISTAGVVELEKRRPVEVLSQLLQDQDTTRLAQLFDDYGPPEAACMCFILATAPAATLPPRVMEGARNALENEQLVGVPEVPEDRQTTLDAGTDFNQGIYMGQAVNPNPEPCWSGDHKGLCLFVSRLLQLAWEQPVVAPIRGSAPPQLELCMSRDMMQVLEAKLRSLDAFLGQQHTRRATRSYSAISRPPLQPLGAPFGALNFTADPLAPGNKRQRTATAISKQDHHTLEIRGLVRRASEALALLQILSEHHLPRLAAKLDDATQAKLKGLALRDLVYDLEAEGVARLLISVLVGEHISTSGSAVEDLAGQLKASCPSYFKEDDDLYYQATAKLKAAEESGSARQRAALASEAVSMLLRVPSSCNLEYLVSQLAYLRQYEGLVELVLKAAEAKDPEHLADNSAAGMAHTQALQLREACYLHIINVLRTLINPLAAGAGAGGSGSGSGRDTLSASERETYKNAVLQAASRSKDRHFQRALYSALVDMDAQRELLALGGSGSGSDPLVSYLIGVGGPQAIAIAMDQGCPIGPLTRSQVHHLDLLAKLYTSQHRFADAARMHKVLGVRVSGSGEHGVSLQARLDHLQQAVLQARSVADSALMTDMDSTLQVALFQRDIADLLSSQAAQAAGGEDAAVLQAAVHDLNTNLKGISDLYNDYAHPFRLWGMCLRIFHFSNQSQPEAVRRLWELVLAQAVVGSRMPLQDACRVVGELGSELYPNDNSYPMALVAARLEQIACGVWPEERDDTLGGVNPGASEPHLVVSTLLATCQNSWNVVQRVYEVLLSRRVEGLGEQELSLPQLRAQLLQSLYQLCVQVKDSMRSGTSLAAALPAAGFGLQYSSLSREAGLLSMACEKYALEARKLGGAAADVLYHSFEMLRRQLDR